MSETGPNESLRETPLTALHREHGARLVGFAGFEMPVLYDGILAEHARVREQVGLFDVSHMGEIRVRGPEATAMVNGLVSNDLERIGPGRAQYSVMCAPDGGIVDDLIVYKLADDDLLLCVNASNRSADLAHIQEHARGDATIVDEGDDWAQIAVQGPQAPELLGRVLPDAAPGMKPFRVRATGFDGHEALLATTGYTGEPGGEIYIRPDGAAPLWRALLAAGEELGVGPAGLGARDTLRLEMAYCLYGNDIDRTTSPLEAGLGWVTKLSKPAFVGQEALRRQKRSGVSRRLVGLELTERGIARQGYPVLADGEVVGHVTSGTRSPSTGRSIALAYLPVALAEPGTGVSVDCRGRFRNGRVVETPFYERAAK